MAKLYEDYIPESMQVDIKYQVAQENGVDISKEELSKEFSRKKFDFERQYANEIEKALENAEKNLNKETKQQYLKINKPLSVDAIYGIDNKQLADDWVYILTGTNNVTEVWEDVESNEDFLSMLQFNWDNELGQAKDELAKPEVKARLQELGYDGLILPLQTTDAEGLAMLKAEGGEEYKNIQTGGNEYIVFDSNQAKNIDNTNPTENPDIRYSIETEEFDRILSENFPDPATEDNNGKKLSQKQQNFFKNSKARSLKDGGLVKVFHTTGDHTFIDQFNEFDPRGDGHYKFGNQIVNYYTDNQKMSGSYGDLKHTAVDTKKINNIEQAQKYAKNNNFSLAENEDGTFTAYDISSQRIYDNAMEYLNNNLTSEEIEEMFRLNTQAREDERLGRLTKLTSEEDEFMGKLWNIVHDMQKDKKYNLLDFFELQEITRGTELKERPEAEELATFENENDLLRNLISKTQGSGIWQYSGYTNIQNPYVIDAKGTTWNQIKEGISEYGQKLLKAIDTLEENKLYYSLKRLQDKAEFDSKKFADKFIEAQNKANHEQYILLGYLGRNGNLEDLKESDLHTQEEKAKILNAYNTYIDGRSIEEIGLEYYNNKYSTLWEKRVNEFKEQNPVLKDLSKEDLDILADHYEGGRAYIENRYAETKKTNEIVQKVIDYNNSLFGEAPAKVEYDPVAWSDVYRNEINKTPEEILAKGGYDGIIIRNVVDYGHDIGTREPGDLYITFGSNQFKAEDNKNPTKDKDIRYSKDTTGDWENYLTKYAKEGTQTFLPGLKEVMPEKKYSIKDFEDVLKEYQFTDNDKKDLLADLEGIKLNKQSLDEFKDFVKQFDENYQESMAMKQDQKEIENNILNTKQTFSTGRKEIYNKYRNDNSNYDKTFINQAKQAVPGNRYGRTKDQWLYVAKTLGNYMANANLTDEQIEKITYRTWLDEAPNQKSNLNRQGEKFVKFNSDDWINAVYNEVNNLRYSMETEKQAPEEEIKLPKKIMNPTEISNLKPEDATTTPNLPEKKYAKGEKTSSFVSNVYNDVGFLNDLQKQDITQDENVRYYKEVTNKKDLENAYKDLQENGQRATLQWYAKNPSESTSEDVAKGWILFKQYADKGDTKDLVNVGRKLRAMGTNGGQVVQAFNILSRLTPEGMVYYAQSELDDAYNEMIKGKSKAWIDQHKADFDLTPEEVAFIMDTMQNLPAENLATHNYERKVALGQIQKLFTDKLPVEKGKIKAWMRISMLFNPKTQVRNVMGNSVVVPVNMFSDFLGSKVDKLLSKYTGVRTLGNTNIKNYLGGMKEGFYQSYNDYKLGINTRDIEQNRFEFGQGKAFKDTGLGKQINRVDNMLNFVMDFGDRGFYQGSFVNSLNNQMLLNGVDTPTQDMIDIATQEALSRTWNDSNDYTKLVLDIRRALNKIGGENYGLGDVLIPFAKTPANLTKAIVEYSPVGLAKSIMDIKGIKNAIETGQFTAQQQHEFVDHLGKGLAGSLLYVISYALAKAGIASGEPDDDKDLKNFMRNSLGISPYSITIGNKSFTYDWAQPIATPLAIMSNLMQYEKNNPDASAIEKVLSSVNIGSNQLLEQSFMQSINEVLNGNGEFTDRLVKAVLDLPARAIPTFSKQIADLVDDTQRTTFEKGKPVQSAINAVVAKIPGASKTLTPAVDTLGHDIKKYGGDNNFFNVFFNPANMNKGQESKAGKEIYDVYMKTGDTTVFPEVAPYYIDGSDGRINLDAEKRAKYQRVEGKYAEEAVEKLLNDASYKRLDPTDKAEILSKVVTDSKEKAKKDVLNIDKKNSDLKLIEKVGTDYYTYKISTKGMSKDAEQCDVLLNKNYSNKNKQLIYESEINKEDKTYNGLKNIDSNFDMDEYLKYKTQTFSGDNRKEDMVTYINDLNLSRAEQLYIKGRNYKLSNSEKYELEYLLEDNPNLEEILDTIK